MLCLDLRGDVGVGLSQEKRPDGRNTLPTFRLLSEGKLGRVVGDILPQSPAQLPQPITREIPSRLTPGNRDSWTCLPLALVVKSARVGLGSGPGRRLEGSTRSVRGVGVRPAPTKRSYPLAVALFTSDDDRPYTAWGACPELMTSPLALVLLRETVTIRGFRGSMLAGEGGGEEKAVGGRDLSETGNSMQMKPWDEMGIDKKPLTDQAEHARVIAWVRRQVELERLNAVAAEGRARFSAAPRLVRKVAQRG